MSNNANRYQIKTLIRIACQITDLDGAPVNPPELTLLIKNPRKIEKVFTLDDDIQQEADGIYYSDYTLDEEGSWYYRWEVGGALPVSDEKELIVVDSEFYELKVI